MSILSYPILLQETRALTADQQEGAASTTEQTKRRGARRLLPPSACRVGRHRKVCHRMVYLVGVENSLGPTILAEFSRQFVMK